MKNFKKTIIISVMFLFFLPEIKAQQCDFFIPFEENAGMEYKIYNQRNRLQGRQVITVVEVKQLEAKTTATLLSKSFDRRDKIQHEMEYDVSCLGNQLLIDMRSFMDQSTLKEFQDMDIRIESKDLIIPSDLAEGRSLPDAEITMIVEDNGRTISTMTTRVVNRQVVGREEVSVPAGTFNCYKITYNTQMETRTMGIPFKMNSRSVEYYAPDIGMVRAESYDQKDRLQSYTILSKIL